MKKAIILLPLILLGLSANAQGVVDQKGSKRVADTTNDSWKNDVPNTQVSLTYRSDNTTARTAGTEFVIKDNGNVGIGTASPGGRLQVTNGDFRLENQNNWNAYKGVTFSNTQYPQLFLFQARGTKASPTYPQSGTTLGVFRSANAIDSTGGAGFRVRSTEQQSAAAHGTSMIIFTNKNGEADNTDQFIVDQSGNVGVGDMAPAQKLTVRGVNAQPTATVSAQTNATLRVSGNTNHNLDFGTYANSPYGAYIQSHDNTTANGLPLVFNPTGGNVGISTDNPQKKLHVNGSLQVTKELNVGGDSTTAGSAGTAGQVLVSHGAGAAPSWTSLGVVSGTISKNYYVQGTTQATIAAGTTADVPGVTITHTVPAGDTQTLLFTVTGYVVRSDEALNNSAQGVFILAQNGTKISSAYASVGFNSVLGNLPTPATLLKAVTLTNPGSSPVNYTFKVQYAAWAGSQKVNWVPSSFSGYNGDTEAMLTKMQVLVYNN